MGQIHNLLHTYATKWLDGFNPVFPIVQNNNLTQIGRLEMLEQQFYMKFGATNYREFLLKIREIFLGAPEDAKALKNFTSENIRKTILQYQDSTGWKQSEHWNPSGMDATITVTVSDPLIVSKKINEALRKFGVKGAKATQTETGDVEIYFSFLNKSKSAIIKAISKGVTGKRFNETHKGKKRDTTQLYEDELVKYFTNNPEDFLGLTFTSIPSQTFDFSEFMTFKGNMKAKTGTWGYTEKDIKKINASNEPSDKAELQLAQDRIKDYIFRTLLSGASPDLLYAAQWEWEKKIEPMAFFKSGTEMNFFAAGQNNGGVYLSKLIGALGEFQFAVFVTYIKHRLLTLGVYPKIIGDISSDMKGYLSTATNEQGKTDVLLLSHEALKWGAQVKNYNINSSMSLISTTIHPEHFVNLVGTNPETGLGRVAPDDFLLFIANCFFNSDYREKEEDTFMALEEFLANEMAGVMSLASERPDLDTVTFYFIGGTYLVPASVILRAYTQKDLYGYTFGKIKITGPKATSESEFHARENSGPDAELPLYLKYWKREPNNDTGWTPVENNSKEFGNILSRISFKTYFDYKEIITKQMNIYSSKR